MGFESVLIAAETHFEDTGAYGLSSWSIPGKTAAEVAEVVGTEALPHPKMRACTVGELRSAGFEVRPTPPPEAHVDIDLPGALTPGLHAALDDVFGPPEPNPVARPKGQSHG